MSLADALEAAASALPADADAIRPANGDPQRLLELLPAEAAPRVLAWLLAERPDDAEELAEAWVFEEAGAAAVLSVSEASLPKAGRKALRRLRHQLRSRGVETPDPEPRPVVATLPAVDDDFRAAYVTPVDPTGTRIVYLVEPNPGGGARLFEVVLDDARGITAFDVYTAPRKRARAFLDGLQSRQGFPITELSPEKARAVVARAARSQPAERPAPRGFSEWRKRIAEAAPDAELPGDEVARALGVTEDRAALETAVEMVRAQRIGPWPVAGEALPQLYDRIRGAFGSALVVSPAARREQIDGLLAAAAEEIYAGEGGALAAHRFRESAYVLWRHGDEAAARACLAAAAAFEAGEPGANPVARALLEAALAPGLEALAHAAERGEADSDGEAEPDEGSRLVTP